MDTSTLSFVGMECTPREYLTVFREIWQDIFWQQPPQDMKQKCGPGDIRPLFLPMVYLSVIIPSGTLSFKVQQEENVVGRTIIGIP